MLTERLRTLEKAEIIYRHQEPTVPPQVTYGLTKEGRELTTILDQLNTLAHTWQDQVENSLVNTNRRANSGKTLLKIS
jgi:DNA-binding HxlR family transcriptional regulator